MVATYPGSRAVIRKAFLLRGLTDNASNLAMSSISDATLRQYNCPLKKWYNFCVAEGIDIFTINLPKIQEFLAAEFNKGASFGSINTYRSALALILGHEIAQDFGIKRICKGAAKLRPPRPKYNSTWDPKVVLDYFDALGCNLDISLENLTSKVATLLALVTAHRMQTLSLIEVNNINISKERIEIKIPAQIKTSKPGRAQPTLILPFFENKNVCAATALLDYLKRTHQLRNNNQNLFISFKKPYKNVGSQTLSRWIKRVLHKSGVDTQIFSAYSTRHASTSAANRMGVSLETIRLTAGWTKESKTFSRFYNLNISKDQDEFAKTILNL